jgi:hypothetical protein
MIYQLFLRGGIYLYPSKEYSWSIGQIKDGELGIFLGSIKVGSGSPWAIWMNQRGTVGISQWIPTEFPGVYTLIE